MNDCLTNHTLPVTYCFNFTGKHGDIFILKIFFTEFSGFPKCYESPR